jgi:transposase
MATQSLEKVKKLIENEPAEILRPLLLATVEEVERLRAALKKAEDDKARANQAHLNIEEQVKVLRRKIFGRSKEDRTGKPDSGEQNRGSQEEAQLFAQAAFPAPAEPESQTDKRANLPERVIDHEKTLEELKAESELRGLENPSAEQWEKLESAFDQVTTIQIIERSYEKQIHRKQKYKLKDEFNPDRDEKTVIIVADGPESLLPGMNYSTEVVASAVTDKYRMHLPLDRQVKEMRSLGLSGMQTSTLSRFCALSAASLEPMAERIKQELLQAAESVALHLDETPWRIQNKDQKDGYMWVISSRLGSYYFYRPSRAGEMIKEKIEGFKGVVLTDGYSGYGVLDEIGIKQGFCWAHGRRGFLPIESGDAGVKAILDDIDELFAIEREAKSFDELKTLREERSRPVVERIREKLIEEYPKSRPKSLKRKAIEYLMKRWTGFTLFLDDIRLPLSNNEAERTIRHAVVGRKSYHGSNNHTGAETAATHFTIIESCKKNEIDPRQFILMTLQRIAAGKPVMTPLEYARHLRMPDAPATV